MMGLIEEMGLNPENIAIERIHRKGIKRKNGEPRPIIMKFECYGMREAVLNECYTLRNIPQAKYWFLAEDFPVEIENKRRKLYPILKVAKKSGKKASIKVDRLIVDGHTYTSNTLQQLPKNLRPQYVSTPSENGYTFFFSEASPLSNFYHAKFVIDEKVYVCSEQYLMEKKAVIAGDEDSATKIMAASDPYTHKALGREIKNFDEKQWLSHVPHILKKGLLAKFEQNEHLKQFLIDTGDTKLFECNKNDKVWSCGLNINDNNRGNPKKWTGKNWLGQLLEDI